MISILFCWHSCLNIFPMSTFTENRARRRNPAGAIFCITCGWKAPAGPALRAGCCRSRRLCAAGAGIPDTSRTAPAPRRQMRGRSARQADAWLCAGFLPGHGICRFPVKYRKTARDLCNFIKSIISNACIHANTYCTAENAWSRKSAVPVE